MEFKHADHEHECNITPTYLNQWLLWHDHCTSHGSYNQWLYTMETWAWILLTARTLLLHALSRSSYFNHLWKPELDLFPVDRFPSIILDPPPGPQSDGDAGHGFSATYNYYWGPHITRGPCTPSVLTPKGVIISMREIGTPIPKILAIWGWGSQYPYYIGHDVYCSLVGRTATPPTFVISPKR